MKGNKKFRRGPPRWSSLPSSVAGVIRRVFTLPWVVPVLVVALVAGILSAVGSRVFILKRVVLEDSGGFRAEEVLDWSGLQGGENLLFLDLQSVVERIKAQRWIANVRIWKVWPNTLRLALTRRRVLACIETSKGYLAIDREGLSLGRLESPPPDAFSLSGWVPGRAGKIEDPMWGEVVLLAEAMEKSGPDSAGRARDVELTPSRLLVRTPDYEFSFPTDHVYQSWLSFEQFRKSLEPEKLREYESFDLTVPDHVYARLRAASRGGPTLVSTTHP